MHSEMPPAHFAFAANAPAAADTLVKACMQPIAANVVLLEGLLGLGTALAVEKCY